MQAPPATPRSTPIPLSERLALAALAVLALATLLAGAASLRQHMLAATPRPARAPCAVVLILLAVAQFWILNQLAAVRRAARRAPAGPHFLRRPARDAATLSVARWLTSAPFWTWLLVGAITGYLVAAALGPVGTARYLCRALWAGWYTVALLPLVAQKRSRSWLHFLADRPLALRLRRAAVWLLFLLAAAEFGLRAWELALDAPVRAAALPAAVRPAAEHAAWVPPSAGRGLNRQGYWDKEFSAARTPSLGRIAALGQGDLLRPGEGPNCLEQLEQSGPGLEVYNFGLAQGGPAAYVSQLSGEVVRYQPDLVLVCLSLGADIVHPLGSPGPFDWRGWRLAQITLGGACGGTSLGSPPEGDYSAYLKAGQADLAICRRPTSDWLSRRWDQALAHLDHLARKCRQLQLPLAIVIFPSEFQVNPSLCETLCRRNGWAQSELDLELPQRRLREFADQRQLPLVDLLPTLRPAGAAAFAAGSGRLNAQGQKLVAEHLSGWLSAKEGR